MGYRNFLCILIFGLFLSCAPRFWEIENECIEASRSLENDSFTSNLILARNGIIEATKTFKSKGNSTEEEEQIRKEYETLRNLMNDLLDNLKVKLTQKEQRTKFYNDDKYLDNTLGKQLDAVRNQYDLTYRNNINKIIHSEYAALGLTDVGTLIALGNEFYRIFAGYIKERNLEAIEHYRDCFERNYIEGKKLPSWEEI